MRVKILTITLLVSIFAFSQTGAVASIDLQADLNRIVLGINKFDANSAATSTISTLTDVKRIFLNNAVILREIRDANAAFKRNLNSAKKYISSRDTKESPAFGTLMNLTKGYEEWLRYQNINQATAQRCINKSGTSFNSFSLCSIASFPKTMENERLGRQKLQSAWNAWKTWQVKFGYASGN